MQANLLDLEYNLPHFCELFRKYADAEVLLDAGPSMSGGGEGIGVSRMFPGLRMTEDGWVRFQKVEQLEHDAVATLELFRAAATRRRATPGIPATGLVYRAMSRRRARDEARTDAVGGSSLRDRPMARAHTVGSIGPVNLTVEGGGSLTFVEFVKLLLSPANRALDPAALVPEAGHADALLSHFWIASSHNSYAVGHQLTGYADEAMYRRLLLQGCRSLEIDCWNGRRGEPVVTHGNTLVNKISFASVAKAVGEAAFVTSQAPVILSLEMHCGAKQQARIAELLKKELGAQLLTCADLECLAEASSRTSAGPVQPRAASEREIPLQALQGRVIVKSKLGRWTPDDADDKLEVDTTILDSTRAMALESRESAIGFALESSLPSKRPSAKPNAKAAVAGSKGVIAPSLRALITMPSVPATHFMSGSLPAGVRGLPVSSLSEPLLLSIFATAGEDLRAEAATRVQRITRGWQARGCTAPCAHCSLCAPARADFRATIWLARAARLPGMPLRSRSSFPSRSCEPFDTALVPSSAQARGFPRGTRIKSDNADPLFQWGMGVQQVALNLQTNDTPTQLHHALFALGGGCGYVLKPREMRAEPPEVSIAARVGVRVKVRVRVRVRVSIRIGVRGWGLGQG